MSNENWLVSRARYLIEEAQNIAHKLLKEGHELCFGDLASGEDADGGKIITCRIRLKNTNLVAESKNDLVDLFQ